MWNRLVIKFAIGSKKGMLVTLWGFDTDVANTCAHVLIMYYYYYYYYLYYYVLCMYYVVKGLVSQSGFNTWKSMLFFQAYCLPKLVSYFSYSVLAITWVLKNLIFLHELCAGLLVSNLFVHLKKIPLNSLKWASVLVHSCTLCSI